MKKKASVIPFRGSNVVDMLRELLERAERGEIVGIAVAYETSETEGSQAAWAKNATFSTLIGALELTKMLLIDAAFQDQSEK